MVIAPLPCLINNHGKTCRRIPLFCLWGIWESGHALSNSHQLASIVSLHLYLEPGFKYIFEHLILQVKIKYMNAKKKLLDDSEL